MDGDPGSRPVETDKAGAAMEEDGPEHGSRPVEGHVEEAKQEGPLLDHDDVSIDEANDITARTSTRLVKFQLFETKSVYPFKSKLT
jgi:hypothetical protein